MTEFEHNVLRDAIEWHMTTNEYSNHIMIDNEKNREGLFNVLLNKPESRKHLVEAYWKRYFGYSSQE